MTTTQARPPSQAPPGRPPRAGPPRPPQSPGPVAALGILVAMILLGALVFTNKLHLAEAPPASRSLAGCQHPERGTPGPQPSSPVVARTTADLVALATVEANSAPVQIPEAARPDLDWITVTYRIDRAFRNTMDCQRTVIIASPLEHGKQPTTQQAPFRGNRVLLFARPATSATFRYISHAAPSVEVPNDASVYQVKRDRSPPTTTGAKPTDGPTLFADVAVEPNETFPSPGPSTEFPVRLTLVNTSSEPIDAATLNPAQWHVKLKDANGTVWSYTTKVEASDFPPTLNPGDRVRVDLITRPEGPSPLRAGIYGLEAQLDTDPGVVATDPKTAPVTVAIQCVEGCKTTG